jgi:hypothetical protein
MCLVQDIKHLTLIRSLLFIFFYGGSNKILQNYLIEICFTFISKLFKNNTILFTQKIINTIKHYPLI